MVNSIVVGSVVLVGLITAVSGIKFYRHRAGIAEVKREWESTDVELLEDVGSTETLEILPLVNWHAVNDEFQTEAGVSYLIKTDHNTILYDVGFNANQESPSPLEHNMEQLDIDLEDLDSIFISHNHLDHVGGWNWSRKNTFSLGTEQVPLDDRKIFVPSEMTYPGTETIKTSEPQKLLEGVASIGTIPRQLFMGRVDEQALAVNLAGKGIVVVVGCCHQTLPRILTRTDQLFDEKLYGVIGDLHFPVPEGRIKILGLDVQRLLASGEGPFHPLTQEEAEEHIDCLEGYNPELVGLGGHDTSDHVIEECKQRFNDAYEPVKVGRTITVN